MGLEKDIQKEEEQLILSGIATRRLSLKEFREKEKKLFKVSVFNCIYMPLAIIFLLYSKYKLNYDINYIFIILCSNTFLNIILVTIHSKCSFLAEIRLLKRNNDVCILFSYENDEIEDEVYVFDANELNDIKVDTDFNEVKIKVRKLFKSEKNLKKIRRKKFEMNIISISDFLKLLKFLKSVLDV